MKEFSKSDSFVNSMQEAYKKKLEEKQDKLLANFNEHPVTQEIELGNGAPNISRTLGGYGNLFTFLGFEEESNPIKIVRDYLSRDLRMQKTRVTSSAKGVTVYFKVETPGIRELAGLTQLSHLGRSWVTGIEQGKIDGFQYYLNRWRKMRGSRSGRGIQIDTKLRNKSLRPTKYIDHMLKKFRSSIEKIR